MLYKWQRGHMDVPARRNRTWMFVCTGCQRIDFLSYKSFEPLMREALNICPERTHPWRRLSCAKTFNKYWPFLSRDTTNLFQSFFITLSAVTQALNINANKKTPLQKERPYDDYFPLCFSSQYLQRYTSFSSSVRIKIWSSSCSIDVIHLGFLQEMTFLISRGSVNSFLSTILSP